MNLQLDLKIENFFKTKDYEDSKTGEVTKSKWKIQTFDNVETENGTKMQLVDISIPDERYFELKDSVGKTVTIPVKTFVNKGRVGYYGI